jgi:glucose-1-phosphate adenylyltransferase
VPREQASAFGIIETAPDSQIGAFREKPPDAAGLPDAPDQVLASMGNYVFTTEALLRAVTADAEDYTSNHDLGGNIVPNFVAQGDATYYDFTVNVVPGETAEDHAYWRDVGTLDAYYDAHMDLIKPVPAFNLYNREWPIFTWHPPLPPAKFVVHDSPGQAHDALVSAGVIVAGGTVRRSVLSPGVRVERGATVEGSVLLDGVWVGPGAVVRNAILDKNVQVAGGVTIGSDQESDRRRFATSANGIVVIGKNQRVAADTP